MPGKKSGKKVASAPKIAGGKSSSGKKPITAKARRNKLFKAAPRHFGIGGDIRPNGAKDVTRFVKWPKYVQLQRQKQVLMGRIKVPPAINQFSTTLDKNTASEAIKLALKYKPESKVQKKQRLLAEAKAKSEGKDVKKVKPTVVKYGLNHVTALVENNQVRLVLIAHDVDPIELVVWLPALCQKKGIPYAIIKGKSRLGQVVGTKTATCIAFQNVAPEDKAQLARLTSIAKEQFNDRAEDFRKTWGGLNFGKKTRDRLDLERKAFEKEQAGRVKFK